MFRNLYRDVAESLAGDTCCDCFDLNNLGRQTSLNQRPQKIIQRSHDSGRGRELRPSMQPRVMIHLDLGENRAASV